MGRGWQTNLVVVGALLLIRCGGGGGEESEPPSSLDDAGSEDAAPSVSDGAIVDDGAVPDDGIHPATHVCCQQSGLFGVDENATCLCDVKLKVEACAAGETSTCQGHGICTGETFSPPLGKKVPVEYGDCCFDTLWITVYNDDSWGIVADPCVCVSKILRTEADRPTCDSLYPAVDTTWVSRFPSKWSEVDESTLPEGWSRGVTRYRRTSSCGEPPMQPGIGGMKCNFSF